MSGRANAWARGALGLLAALLVLTTLIPLIVSNQWWIRIFVFPQAQIAVLLLIVALIVPFVFGMRRPAGLALMAVLLACLVYQLQYLLRYSPLWPEQMEDAGACPAERRVRVLVLNVKEGDVANPPTLDLVSEVRPDLFLAVETEPVWLERMAALRQSFPHVVAAPRGGAWGMTLFSRLPLEGAKVRYLVDDYVPSIKARVRLPSGQRFDFYGLHPKPPLMHDTARGDAELLRAGREIAAAGAPAILAGDLNDVPWSHTTRRFHEISGMRDPRAGRAFDATFRPDLPIPTWPLDHVFGSGQFELIVFDPLRDVGSDHAPVLAIFCLGREAS